MPLMNLVFSLTPSKKTDSSGLNLTCEMSDFALRVNHPFENTAKGCLHVNLESITVNFIREHEDCNLLCVSVITDIGNANINYDMRRLSEILAFPKAWYNRSITRRLFLGDTKRQKNRESGEKSKTKNQWQTAVRVSTVLRELRVEMNIGNVLGKTIWVTELLTYHGAFDIKSCQNNDLKNIVSLKKSKLESRSGLLGGTIVMNGVEGSCIWRDRNGNNEIKSQLSQHKIDVGLDEISIRIEYHSSVILLSKLLQAKLLVLDGSDHRILHSSSHTNQRPKVLANLELR